MHINYNYISVALASKLGFLFLKSQELLLQNDTFMFSVKQ